MEKQTEIHISIGMIHVNPVELRPCDETDIQYLSVFDTIKNGGTEGLILPIGLRPANDNDRALICQQEDLKSCDVLYIVTDGLQRFTACKALGHATIPGYVRDVTADQALIDQFVANNSRVTTRPAAFATQIQRIMGANPTMTLQDMANSLGVPLSLIQTRLRLKSLTEDAKVLVDEGSISLSNAYALAKLPEVEQDIMMGEASTETDTAKFASKVKERNAEIKKEKQTGEKAPVVFIAKVSRRSRSELETAISAPGMLVDEVNQEGFVLGLKYALSLDAETVQAKEEEWNIFQAEKEAKAIARAEARAAKKEESVDTETDGTEPAVDTEA